MYSAESERAHGTEVRMCVCVRESEQTSDNMNKKKRNKKKRRCIIKYSKFKTALKYLYIHGAFQVVQKKGKVSKQVRIQIQNQILRSIKTEKRD